jgi:AcrR family transcriptional regulator
MTVTSAPEAQARRRNPRGSGDLLRHDIIEAACQVVAETGDAGQLTLRGVAKRLGIAAPSIYRHFPDIGHLRLEVVERAFRQFAKERDEARRHTVGPVSALLAGCRAYCAFAVQHQGEYRFMFSHASPAHGRQSAAGAAAFAALESSIRRCQEAGACASVSDPTMLAGDVWAALHGIALLRINVPEFEWQSSMNSTVDRVVLRLVDVAAPESGPNHEGKRPKGDAHDHLD